MPDIFANIASISCTESAANTLTFKKLETGVGFQEKLAWVIAQLEIFHDTPMTAFADTDDRLYVGLTVSNNLASIGDLANPAEVLFYCCRKSEDGTPASSFFMHWPWVRDFTTLPGGGLIIVPNPLYLAVCGVGLASAQSVNVRFYYTARELKTEEYWELVESRRVISS